MQQPFIDAHVHLNTPTLQQLQFADEYDVQFLSINTDIPFFPSLTQQQEVVTQLKRTVPNTIQHITSFNNQYWNTEQWLPRIMKQVKQGVENGAVGLKLWKNIGMDRDLKDEQGQFVFVDDDRFHPLYEYIIENNLVVVGHQGEPKNCWLPLHEMTMESDRDYFEAHPEYHMYLQSNVPSYEQQMAARDNLLNKYPQLNYVGLHLFSLEWSINEVAKRLKQFPNTMTDLAERICHVQYQAMTNYDAVRNFFIEFQDRVIYGTDVIDDGSMTPQQLKQHFETLWNAHWDFFATDQLLTAPEFDGKFQGLKLPEPVLRKIFYENAASTYNF